MNVVHIGYPKTGTTFLQWEIFPHMKDYQYIDYHTCKGIFQEVIYLDDLDYNHGDVQSRLNKVIHQSNVIASFEALTGAPFTFKGLGRSNIPYRLENLGFEKIIITIRNQVEIIDSLYRQYVIQGGVMKFKDFLNLNSKWNPYLRAFDLNYLKFHSLIECYFNVFGKENVLVLPQELLKSNAKEYYMRLFGFLNDEAGANSSKKVNASLSNLSINLLRIINHFTFNSQRPNQLITNHLSSKNVSKLFMKLIDPYILRFISSRRSFLSLEQMDHIKKFYSGSNIELKTMVNDDFMELGYG